ncbi:uncharacterized protein LOC135849274 isoform X2 [Planococcus citri]|uniref:uncharacterized protein LOC135849274 isoform X2 n=1 Tax=Planococcus citri TaxID=170843 RepID=UPI0031F90E16
MDARLHDPNLLENFDKLKKKFGGFFNVKNKEWRFDKFKKEYEAFVDYTEKCLNDYILQFDQILQWGDLGNQGTRNALLQYYNNKFIKKMKLKGYFDEEGTLKNLHERLSGMQNAQNCVKSFDKLKFRKTPIDYLLILLLTADALQKFYDKIAQLKDTPPAPIFIIPEINYEEKQHKDSHSHSHSGGVSAGDVAVPLVAAGAGLVIGAELAELASEHKQEEEKQEEVKHVEEEHESSSSSASSAAEDHAALESGGGGSFEEAFE